MPTPHYGLPRYRVIADELRERIESGVIPPGALLPTERVLTAEFRVSRGTIRQAITVLRNAGLVATEHGRGTCATSCQSGIGSDKSAAPETRQREVAAGPELAALFGVKIGTILVEQQSVSRTRGAVGAVIRTYRLLEGKP
ncbi:GntR family transcriptional regulator [Micromonospora musae]|uniref:GntR family transcriptional regulator n=1 Tax=Micromonospora musae TaxID=1894970 RepID=A0A3A9XQD4_9ACTN|nr:GntR family transcriptional regulator [Micromonospora musae]RKN26932.1 GntR family transcriptional regulator [Micromonospora musae]